eukprot:3166181-Ditylum_brightwellii.AAC.1
MMQNLMTGHRTHQSSISSLQAGQDYMQRNHKHQRYGVDVYKLDENMTDKDALHKRDDQASNLESDCLGDF